MAITIQVSAVEVNQAIQHLSNKSPVPIIHGKKTFIRLYCKVSVDNKSQLTDDYWSAKLLCKYVDKNGKNQTLSLPPVQSVRLSDIATDQASARTQWNAALSFTLHESTFFEDTKNQFKDNKDTLALTITELKTTSPASSKTLIVEKLKNKTVHFQAPVELYCRAIGYSYQDPETGDITEPTSAQLQVIFDFIESAFPVSKVNWSYNSIEAPRSFTQVRQALNESNRAEEKIDELYQLLFQHLLALRAHETSLDDIDSIDPRTIYLGVLSDPTGRFGGASMDSPNFPTPHIVAFANAENDGSLAAHEISHLLGSLHPGIPNKNVHGRLLGQTNQTHSDDPIDLGMSDIGQIDDTSALPCKDRLIGLQSLPGSRIPELLDSTDYFDLTTYRTPSWLSQYNYTELYERLRDIDALDFTINDKKYINLMGSYNLINKEVTVQFALESRLQLDSSQMAKQQSSPLTASCGTNDGHPVYVRGNPEKTDTNFSLGVFQYSIEKTAELRNSAVDLKLNDNVAATVEFPTLSASARQRLLNEELVKNDPELTKKVTDASFTKLDKLIASAEQSSVLNKDNNPEPLFSFQFHLRESSLYLNYNWTDPLIPAGKRSIKTEAIHSVLEALSKKQLPIENALQLINYTQAPITTIVEFKYPKPVPHKLPGDHAAAPDILDKIDRWETAYISTRLYNDKVWVPHRYVIQSLNTYARGGSGLPDFDSQKCKSTDVMIKTAIFNIQCRVTLAVAGHTIKLFETALQPKKNKRDNVMPPPLPTYARIIGNVSGTRKNDGQQKPVTNAQPPGKYDSLVDFQKVTSD